MIRLFLILCITASCFSWAIPVQASDWKFGLAMHGAPKHSSADQRFSYASANAVKGGHLNRAVTGTFDTLVPYTIKGKSAAGLGLITDSLMARSWDEPFTMYPLIAEGYKIADDRSWITFKIHADARFHDGHPITTDDVKFSFETLKQFGRPNMRRIYGLVSAVTTPTTDTITFAFGAGFDQETALILSMMPILPQHYWADKDFDKTTLTPPLGSGAYKIHSFDSGRSITYERMPNYWAANTISQAGQHNFDTITFHYFRDDGVALEAFKAGQISLRHEPNVARWINAYTGDNFDNKTLEKHVIAHQRPERAKGLIFNTRRAPFDNIKLRQALSLLLDSRWINDNLFYGQYKRINSYYPNSELSADTAPFASGKKRADMRRAYALLDEAGYTIENGKRIHAVTRAPINFEILLSNPEDEKIALNFKRSLQKAGIDVQIHVMDSAAYRDRMNDYDFDMTLYYWQSSLSPGTEQLLYFGCDAANQPARWNFPGICDADIDRLADSIARSTSRTKLITAAQMLDKKLMDGFYMIPLFYNGADYYAYQSTIQRPDYTPLYGAVIETWWMDPAE